RSWMTPSFSFALLLFDAPPADASYPLSLHDALPISISRATLTASTSTTATCRGPEPKMSLKISPKATPTLTPKASSATFRGPARSEEHTSELQSRFDLVCRLLLEKKNTGLHHTALVL